MVDILEHCKAHKKILLPDWVTEEDEKFINNRRRNKTKNNMRKFLCLLIKQDFEKMQNWLVTEEEVPQNVQSRVWTTFKEFKDHDLNMTKLRCLRCRITANTCVKNIADQLMSAGIIEENLFFKLIDTEQKVGSQEELWNEVFDACLQYHNVQNVVCVFKVVLTDLHMKSEGRQSQFFKQILSEMRASQEEPADTVLQCQCHLLCSQHLHPVSCLKSFTLAGEYMSQRQTVDKKDQTCFNIVNQNMKKQVTVPENAQPRQCRNAKGLQQESLLDSIDIPDGSAQHTARGQHEFDSSSSLSTQSSACSGSSEFQASDEVSSNEDQEKKKDKINTRERKHGWQESRQNSVIRKYSSPRRCEEDRQSRDIVESASSGNPVRRSASSRRAGDMNIPMASAHFEQLLSKHEMNTVINNNVIRPNHIYRADNVFVSSVIEKHLHSPKKVRNSSTRK